MISRFITTLRSLKVANNILSLTPPQQTLCKVSEAERSVTSPRSPSSCMWRRGEANPVHQITSPPLLTTTPHWLFLLSVLDLPAFSFLECPCVMREGEKLFSINSLHAMPYFTHFYQISSCHFSKLKKIQTTGNKH